MYGTYKVSASNLQELTELLEKILRHYDKTFNNFEVVNIQIIKDVDVAWEALITYKFQ